MKQKYGLDVVYDSWSNGKLIKEAFSKRNRQNKQNMMQCSVQTKDFYDYYKLAPK